MRFQAAESLAEQIAQYVGKQIITGVLAPGQRIQELRVAGDLSVSRGSVREALLLLERRHLVNIYARRGAVVAALSQEDAAAIYDMYAALLVTLGKLAAQKWSIGDLAPLETHVRQLEILSGKDAAADQLVEQAFKLMDLCIPIVRNQYLAETLHNFRFAVSRLYFLASQRNPQEFGRSAVFYADLIEAVRGRDGGAVEKLILGFAEHQKALIMPILSSTAGGSDAGAATVQLA